MQDHQTHKLNEYVYLEKIFSTPPAHHPLKILLAKFFMLPKATLHYSFLQSKLFIIHAGSPAGIGAKRTIKILKNLLPLLGDNMRLFPNQMLLNKYILDKQQAERPTQNLNDHYELMFL